MSEIERRLARGVAPGLDAALLGDELGRRALDAGLADVAYGSMDSPVGELLVAVTIVAWCGWRLPASRR